MAPQRPQLTEDVKEWVTKSQKFYLGSNNCCKLGVVSVTTCLPGRARMPIAERDGGVGKKIDKHLITHVKFSKEGKVGLWDRRRVWTSCSNSGRNGKERR